MKIKRREFLRYGAVVALDQSVRASAIPSSPSDFDVQSMSLVWADDFDGSDLNTSNWTVNSNTGTPLYTVANGRFSFFPHLDPSGHLVNQQISTDGRVLTPTGAPYRVDFRARLPAGLGRWPALWLRNSFPTAVPTAPELDVLEAGVAPPTYGDGTQPLVANQTSWIDSGLSGAAPANQTNQSSHAAVAGMASAFHVYSVLVDPGMGAVQFLVDGIPSGPLMTKEAGTTRSQMCMNITDQYDGPFNTTYIADPATTVARNSPLVIDYVRMYQ